MHLSALDLNLLVVLDALLDTGSTTVAARRLALSQSATSHALGRLRELFDDPLLVREGRRLVPTPFALGLAPRVRGALRGLEDAIREPARFEPRTTTRVFTIGAIDYGVGVLLPALAARFAREAPSADLFVRPIGEASIETLAREEVDLILAPTSTASGPDPAWVRRDRLFEDRFRCLVRRDHPLGRSRLTLDRFCALSHVLVAPSGASREGIVDAALARIGRRRRVAVAVPSFFAAPAIVRETDYVLTLAERVARDLARSHDLRSLEPPLDLPGFTIAMHWHARNEADPGHRYLRETVRALSRGRASPAL